MAETTPRVRRGRRRIAVNPQLRAARERNLAQLTAQRARELAVEDALEAYIAAGERIQNASGARDREIEALRMSITRAEDTAREAIETEHDERAGAAWAIHDAGRTVAQVADLLHLPPARARALIGRGRALSRAAGADDGGDGEGR